MKPYCDYCNDTCLDPEDPDRQADCRFCGGSFAWRQRAAHYAKQQPANARFWLWWNSDWVKLTLRPGETVTLHEGGPTDEGWYSEAHTYTLDDGVVYCSIDFAGSDCDGRHEDHRDFTCPIADLKANEADDEGRPARPDWTLEDHRCRDQYAELAGY